jgi:hypothetical protein
MTRSFSFRVGSLDRRLLPLALAALIAGAFFPTTLRADVPDLPFSFKATEEKIDSLPDYMGPNNKIDMDFPFCPVKIGNDFWVIYHNGYNAPVLRYKGTNIEDAVRQPDGTATFPIRSGYILGGVWYDASTQTLYAPLHGEMVATSTGVRREVHLASSTDLGLTWKYLGAIITSPDELGIKHPETGQSGLYWDGGDGDQQLYVDAKGGYAYLYTNHYYWPKLGSPARPFMERRVARCSLDDKLAPGKWKKWYNGDWSEPGIGGKGSPVNADVITYNTYLKKFVTFNGASSLAFCSDLADQDWTPSYAVGPYWCSTGQWAIWPTDDSKSDTSTSGQDFYVYNFWQGSPGRRFKCEFNTGALPAANGFTPTIFPTGVLCTQASMASSYGFSPLYESDDAVVARHTRRVGSASAEITYKGNWTDSTGNGYYEDRARSASDKGAEMSFTFHGREIYWRTVFGPDQGKADVYLDGKLASTVDCWATQFNPLPIGFMRRELADHDHVIRVVVRGDKNPLSSGTIIRMMDLEYATDSWRASDGFTSVAGKNGWTNQERAGADYTDLTYTEPLWLSNDGCQVGFTRMIPGTGDAVRKFTAPHDGTVRIEGLPTLDDKNAGELDVSVLKNDASAWTGTLGSNAASAPCDINVDVKKGDALCFVVHSSAPPTGAGPGLEVLRNKDALQVNKRAGKPIKIGTQEFQHGLYFQSANKILVHLPAPARSFNATVGFDANQAAVTQVTNFVVKEGDRILFKPDATVIKPEGFGLGQDLNGATDFEIDADAETDLGDAKAILTDGKEVLLSDLPLQDQHDGPPSVEWDPVVTYVK